MDIKDFIVLRQEEAIFTTLNQFHSTLTWNIPPSYYSNQRDNTCSVMLIDAYSNAANSNDNKLSILTNLSIQNQANSGNTLPYLGKLIDGSIETDHINMELLTSARPTTISFNIKNLNNANGVLSGALTGCLFVLQFKYYNAIKTSDNLVEQYSPKL